MGPGSVLGGPCAQTFEQTARSLSICLCKMGASILEAREVMA